MEWNNEKKWNGKKKEDKRQIDKEEGMQQKIDGCGDITQVHQEMCKK